MKYSKLHSYTYIYIGTIFYVLASYYHLSIQDWSLKKALILAIPFVCIEYFFSLRGNRQLNEIHNINAIEILLITMCFYFINMWLLNYYVIKNKVNLAKEVLSFILILSAFYLSSNIKIN